MRTEGDSRDATTDAVPRTVPELFAAAVPAPRPEVLARVLAGLRDLPDTPVRRDRQQAATPARGDECVVDGVPLPRRRG